MANDSDKSRRPKARSGAGSTRQRPDGRWEHRLTLPDGRRKSVYGATYTECRDNVREILKQLDKGRDVTKRDPTVKEFLADWIQFADDGKRAASTIRSYRHHVERHITPAIGHHKLSKLSAKHVDELLAAMQRTGRSKGQAKGSGLSPRSAQITRTVLHQALEQALRWDMVTRNVAALTKNPTVPARERHPLTPGQLKAFIEHTRDHRLGPLFQVAIATGMRQGELLGLRWSDVDLTAGTLAVKQALKRDAEGKLTYGAPKTAKSRRVIALPAFAVEALEQQRRNQAIDQEWAGDRWAGSGLVFTSSIGTPLDASNVTHTFQAELEAAGLPRQRFHDLRHAAATIMALQRIPPNVARDVLGHSQIGITMDVYTHTDISEYRRAADAIGEALRLDMSPSNDDEAVS